MKTALITGITGQDGSYLAELLLLKGYKVHGLIRSFSGGAGLRLLHIENKIALHVGDISDEKFVRNHINSINPDEIYHLATNHEVGFTSEEYVQSASINIDSTRHFLSAIDEFKYKCRFFYASSSKIFGPAVMTPQNEETIFNPDSIYSITKVAGMHLVRLYRNQRNLFACSGILYNHESPRRDLLYLPKKITSTAVRIKLGIENKLSLGDLDAKRDWGFAGDYVAAMWMMLQAKEPKDYVIGTGTTHSVEWVLNFVFSQLKLDWREHVIHDPGLVRTSDAAEMRADIAKIKVDLGWEPKTDFPDILKMMIESELQNLKP